MVFASAWICISIDVVLCHNSLLWKLLPKGSQRTSRACCQCNSCFDIYNCSANYSCHHSVLALGCYNSASKRSLGYKMKPPSCNHTMGLAKDSSQLKRFKLSILFFYFAVHNTL